MTTAVKSRIDTDRRANGAPAAPARRRLSDFACKQVMAVTGIVFGLYVLLHMLGDLKAYLGPGEFGSLGGVAAYRMVAPAYSSVLWVIRVVLRGASSAT